MTAHPPTLRPAHAPAQPDRGGRAPMREAGADVQVEFTPAQKAAVILGLIGTDAAGPILERLGETELRNFAGAMASLRRIGPEAVERCVREFLDELGRADMTVNGGLEKARAILSEHVSEETLTRIMEEIDDASARSVWDKLARVEDQALAEFLVREHPQTAAVVLSKLGAEHAARILGRINAGRARAIVQGLTRITSLSPSVIDAIGNAVSVGFLARRRGGQSFRPAERIGAIMNHTSGEIRDAVLSFLDETQPEIAEAVRSRMFTFQDIPDRVERRDIALVVRATEPETLLKALAGAAENAPETRDFILAGISSRFADQLREELADAGRVKLRDAEEAQNEIMRSIRELEAAGQIKLVPLDD